VADNSILLRALRIAANHRPDALLQSLQARQPAFRIIKFSPL